MGVSAWESGYEPPEVYEMPQNNSAAQDVPNGTSASIYHYN